MRRCELPDGRAAHDRAGNRPMRAVRRVNRGRPTSVQPKRMAVQAGLQVVQLALVGSQTPMRRVRKGLPLNGSTRQNRHQERRLQKFNRIRNYVLDVPRSFPGSGSPSGCLTLIALYSQSTTQGTRVALVGFRPVHRLTLVQLRGTMAWTEYIVLSDYLPSSSQTHGI